MRKATTIDRRHVLKLGAAALSTGLLLRARVLAMAPRRILFLGGTGFIGPHIIHAALARGHQVAMMNRGQREPNQNAADFARVEAIRGDRSLPDAYANLAGKKWDVVIDTATNIAWTRDAAAALKGSAGRFIYISSTGVFLPYRTVDIPEDGPVPLRDTPPQDPPSYGVIKALSEQEVRNALPGRDLIIRPSYIVGPGDTSDRFTYWPMRMTRGGEVPVPGRKHDFVQYVDVRDLAEWMVAAIEGETTGTFNIAGPATKQTLSQFVEGLRPLATAPVSFTWIEDYGWLKAYPLRKSADGKMTGLTYSIPWVMSEGDELGHTQISNGKAIAAGLKFRPLLTTARDTIAWRTSDAVPEALRKQPRYVLTPEQEQALLAAWKSKA
ncbi:MAG TPA: NAD-dependent epimerase/dehydratase family protein [Vicinamibacterales bacterium]|nr:NAD-dependent epimerase/dehydratase family protein [Vicinamibacterales bacterium]